jgi:hypothetical protein
MLTENRKEKRKQGRKYEKIGKNTRERHEKILMRLPAPQQQSLNQ